MRKTVGKKRIRGRAMQGVVIIGDMYRKFADDLDQPTTTDKVPKKMTRVVFTEPQRYLVEKLLTLYSDEHRAEFIFVDDVAMRNLRLALRNVTFEIDELEKEHLLIAIEEGAFWAENHVEGNLIDRCRAVVEQLGVG